MAGGASANSSALRSPPVCYAEVAGWIYQELPAIAAKDLRDEEPGGRRKMRKDRISAPTMKSKPAPGQQWLDLARIASVEFTSEDPAFPVDSCFSEEGSGWRSAEPGPQTIRLLFDRPGPVRRIQLEFVETETERAQEFTLGWAAERSGPFREMVRQQWNFSPQGSTREGEDYQVNLDGVAALELVIKPNLDGIHGVASLARWRVA